MLRRLAIDWRQAPVPRMGLLVLLAATGTAGCAHGPGRSVAHGWQNVPSISWGRGSESQTDDKEPGEPKVAANAPSGKSGENKEPETGNRLFRWSSLTGNKPEVAAGDKPKSPIKLSDAPRDPFLEEELIAEVRKLSEEDLPDLEDHAPPARTQRARLKAALDDDSRSLENLAQAKRQEDQLRLRVESLYNRAQQLFESGELVAAKRAAELAQSLVESGGLEFAPDEVRPIDLLAQIGNQLEPDAVLPDEMDALSTTDELSAADKDPESAATQVSMSRKSASPPDQPLAFDPYAEEQRRADVEEESPGVIETSLVVLESPIFEYETEAADDTRQLANQPLAIAETTDSLRTVPREIPSPPTGGPEDSTAGNAEGPVLNSDNIVAPAPPIALPEPTAGALPQPDVFRIDDDEAAEIVPAAALPRWMPISLIAALVASFSVWLWRQRSASRP